MVIAMCGGGDKVEDIEGEKDKYGKAGIGGDARLYTCVR